MSDSEVSSLGVSVRRRISDRIDIFIDSYFTRSRGRFPGNYLQGSFDIAQGSPGNVFDQSIRVTTPLFGIDQSGVSEDENIRGIIGGVFRLPSDWMLSADYAWNRTEYQSKSMLAGGLDSGALDSIVAGQIDIFRDGSAGGIDFSPYILSPSLTKPVRITLNSASSKISGPVPISLPGGRPSVTFLIEARKEESGDHYLIDRSFSRVSYGRDQSVVSAYAEALFPFISPSNDLRGVRELDLQLAVRWDNYDLSGANTVVLMDGMDPVPEINSGRRFSSVDPTVAIKYSPFKFLALRMSYGTGFMPPSLSQIVPSNPRQSSGAALGLTDPRRGGEAVGDITVYSGGDPSLSPEESKSKSVGIVFEPDFFAGFRASVDWVSINKTDNIQALPLSQQYIDSEELIPGLVERGAASGDFDVGPIVSYRTSFMNVASQDVRSLDIAVDYSFPLLGGEGFASVYATKNISNKIRVVESVPSVERVDWAILEWRGNVEVGWSRGNWSFGASSRYVDSYCVEMDCNYGVSSSRQGAGKISDQKYHDLMISYAGRMRPGSWLDGAEIGLGIKNFTNELPPVVTSFPYYSPYGDPRLRSYYLSVRAEF